MTRTADVVVVGAGVIGAAISLELARAGREVVVVDKAGGVGHGSTSASSAIVRFHYSTRTAVALAWEARQVWADWAAHLGRDDAEGLARFVRTGMLVLEAEPGESAAITGDFDAVGVPWERWTPAQVGARRLDAGAFGPPAPVDSEAFFADAHGELGGTWTPDAGYVDDAALAAHDLAEAARARGATYLLRHEVSAVEEGGSRRWWVVAQGQAIEADVVINAAGPWSSAVNALAGVGAEFTVTSRPLRQEVHWLPTAEGLPLALADPDLGTYLRPAAGGLLVGGMEPECDPLEWLADPDEADPRVSAATYEAQSLRAARRIPGLSVPGRPSGVVGVYDAASDWTPVYDRTGRPGFYVAMGTSGNQFKNAPVVGQLVAALVEAVEAGHDHDRDPLVWTAPRTGQPIELATYSRLRTVDPDAPTSVMG
ncbi:FAD-binding oxidoreductase [Nocardioides anomalus]|uniref:FAD-binding oxidoreductase n=1 Tax=Nocardioides anomalus TaxID=2712223 RepID=A0A6G6WDR3_9ACTN|nr:FAD-dependent oxidoreductase [Nocardioides anomalus]QIG43346.1 FAD-binding oxidoreductase [Nocardioides anomalus]